MGKLRLVTWSRSPSLSVGVGVGLIAPVGAPGPGLLGPREGDTGLEVLDSRLWGPAMSLLEALSRWDPSPGHLCCYYLGQRLAAGPGLRAPVGCPCFFELLGGSGLFASIVRPALWVSGGQRPWAEADQSLRFPRGSP